MMKFISLCIGSNNLFIKPCFCGDVICDNMDLIIGMVNRPKVPTTVTEKYLKKKIYIYVCVKKP